jgi:hypothetical protein
MTRKDFNSLQEIYPYIKNKSIYTTEEALNLRKQLDNMGIWEEGKSSQSKLTSKELRKTIDTHLKQQVPEI